MTDLHTHILPYMDDGAENPGQSIEMLKAEAAQGIKCVALTPHFYRYEEDIEHFLDRREKAINALNSAIAELPAEEQSYLPEICIGTEIAVTPNIENESDLPLLCYEGTNKLLVELPMHPWNDSLINQLYNLLNNAGVIPVIAHIDRYFHCQSSSSLAKIAELGLPTQISAEAFEHFPVRRRAYEWIKYGNAELIISDCHNMTDRAPNVKAALDRIEKHFGADKREMLERASDTIIE